MVTTSQHKRPHSIKIEFSEETATSFAGLALVERVASRLGLWPILETQLPERNGQYSWIAIVKAVIAGLLSGARGTFATQDLREDIVRHGHTLKTMLLGVGETIRRQFEATFASLSRC